MLVTTQAMGQTVSGVQVNRRRNETPVASGGRRESVIE
jgi:hypothetical protein